MSQKFDCNEMKFESKLSLDSLVYLKDRLINGSVVFPTVGYIEMALAAAIESSGVSSVIMMEINFKEALILTSEYVETVQLILTADASGKQTSFQVLSQPKDDKQKVPWTLHAYGKIYQNQVESTPSLSSSISLADIRAYCSDEISGTEYYHKLLKKGLKYGTLFQSLIHLWRCDGEALGQIQIPPNLITELNAYYIHPVIFDTALQILEATQSAENFHVVDTGIFQPISLEKIHIYRSGITKGWSYARLRRNSGLNTDILKGDVYLLGESGEVVVEVLGLCLQRLDRTIQRQSSTIKITSESPLLFSSSVLKQPNLVLKTVLNKEPEERQQLLESYLCEEVSGLLELSKSKLDPNKYLNKLGLDSLMALDLKHRLKSDLQVDISIVDFIQDTSIAQLARKLLNQITEAAEVSSVSLSATQKTLLPEIQPALEQLYLPFPLTDVQQAYWIGRSNEFELGNIATQIYLEFETVDLDLEKLTQAWQQLIRHHDMLRAIVLSDGQQQILEKVPPYEIQVLNLCGQDPQESASQLKASRDRMSHESLSCDQWPLFEIRASQLDNHRVRVHFKFDALIGDAWSILMLIQQLSWLYQNSQSLTPLEISFRDYVLTLNALQNSELYRTSQQYWFNRLSTLPPGPNLPLTKLPASVRQPRFIRRSGSLDSPTWSKLKNLAMEAGLTASGILLAAFAEILTFWSKNPRFTINLTLFNRLPLHPQVNDIIGDFTSLTLLEVNNCTQNSFKTRAQNLQQQLWEDLEHRYVSGVEVLRELARSKDDNVRTFMPVVFTSGLGLENFDNSVLGDVVYGLSQTPQVWLDHQVNEQGGKLYFDWDAVEEIFPSGLLDDMFNTYCKLLQQLASDEKIWQNTKLPLLPPEQLLQRASVNATDVPVSPQLLHTLFDIQVQEHGQQIAVEAPQHTLTYDQLYLYSNYLANWLHQMGACPNTLVAIVMEKGWEQVVGCLGILRSGAAYVPIDPDLPRERRWNLLKEAEVQLVLTQSWLNQSLEWPERIQILCVNTLEFPEENLLFNQPLQTPDDLAYVIYTSGSTGTPKGVIIDHQGAVNTILDVNRRFEVGPSDRVLALSSLGFDLSVYDIFGTLAAGGTIVIPESIDRKDPQHWTQLISQKQVTVWNSVPALMQMLVDYASIHPSVQLDSLRLVLLSGDWIPLDLPDTIKKLCKGVSVISLGGATEASIWSILYPITKVDPAWKSIPYGQPMSNQRFYVLNEALEDCPTWVPGTLYVGGVGLAKGYWQNKVKTQSSFITHPVSGERLYNTGDLGFYLPDGNISFIGRLDFQVKVQGYRIELGEVEAALEQLSNVKKAVVQVIGEQQNSKRLVAYIVSHQSLAETSKAIEKLRQDLKQKLPEYMVPSNFMFLDQLPLTSNGKVDRRALPEPKQQLTLQSQAPQVNNTSTIAQISKLVENVLKIENIDPYADLLELGATSVDMVGIANLLEKQFHYRLKISELARFSTVSALTKYYEEYLQREAAYKNIEQLNGGKLNEVLTSFKVELDLEKREQFKKKKLGLRQGDSNSYKVHLLEPELNNDLKRKYLERRSRRKFKKELITFQEFSQFLSCWQQLLVNDKSKYLYASAGGLYPVQPYIYIKPNAVEKISGGTYYYHPAEHQLIAIQLDVEIDRRVHGFQNQLIFDESAFSIFLVGELAAIAPLYGELSRDFCLIEAGLMSQLLDMSARNYNIGLCQIGNCNFDSVRHLFALENSHIYLYCLLGGRIDFQTEEFDFNSVTSINDWEEGSL